jgi:hypothetical protein
MILSGSSSSVIALDIGRVNASITSARIMPRILVEGLSLIVEWFNNFFLLSSYLKGSLALAKLPVLLIRHSPKGMEVFYPVGIVQVCISAG